MNLLVLYLSRGEQRIQPGDIGPGMLMATPDNDPRLEPGFAATDLPADADPAE